MFCLILKGPSAVGKSTLAARLFRHWYPEMKVAQIHGGYLQSMISKNKLNEEELDLKYVLMSHLVIDLGAHHYNIIIQDIFRRHKDLAKVVQCAQSNNYSVHVINLMAPLSVLEQRNRHREPLDYKTEEVLIENYEEAISVRHLGEITIDTSQISITEAMERITQIIFP